MLMNTVNPNPIALIIDPRKDEREDARHSRGDYPSTETTCFCCGRKAGSHWVAIDMRTTSAVSNAWARANDDDAAWFPIGPVCRKAIGIPRTHVMTRRALFRG